MDRMRAQAARWGADLFTEDVEELDLSERPFRVRTSEREVRAHSVVLATGATARRLGLPSEERFWSAATASAPPARWPPAPPRTRWSTSTTGPRSWTPSGTARTACPGWSCEKREGQSMG